MNKVQALRYRAMGRVRDFLRGLKLAAGPALDALVARFLAAFTRIEEGIQEQDSADAEAHALTARLQQEEQLLVADHLRPIVHGARVLYGRRGVELKSFRMPAQYATVEELLAAAGTLAEAATPIEAELVTHGLAPDFLAELRAQVAAIGELASRRNLALERRGGARAEIRQAMSKASTVIGLLNALLTKALRNDSKQLEAWRIAMRVAEVPRPRRKSGSAAATTAADAPAVAPKLGTAVSPVVAAAAPVVSAAPEPGAPSTGEAKA